MRTYILQEYKAWLKQTRELHNERKNQLRRQHLISAYSNSEKEEEIDEMVRLQLEEELENERKKKKEEEKRRKRERQNEELEGTEDKADESFISYESDLSEESDEDLEEDYNILITEEEPELTTDRPSQDIESQSTTQEATQELSQDQKQSRKRLRSNSSNSVDVKKRKQAWK